jgi:hypothetical protein
MEENKKSKTSLRAKADKIKDFRCKNLRVCNQVELRKKIP